MKATEFPPEIRKCESISFFLIPLKQKHNNPNRKWRMQPKGQTEPGGGTWVFNAGRFHSRTASQGGNKVKTPSQGYGNRRRAYGPF